MLGAVGGVREARGGRWSQFRLRNALLYINMSFAGALGPRETGSATHEQGERV